jgi:hypothetical protein
MKNEKEIKERINDLKLMLLKDKKNKTLYKHWLDAMFWVLDDVYIESEVNNGTQEITT